MRVLYAGDDPGNGTSKYLRGILRTLSAEVVHVPSGDRLAPQRFTHGYDLIIFSDMARVYVPRSSEQAVVNDVKAGAGLLMVGGWGSFAAPSGRWGGSAIDSLLPVTCAGKDDRISFPTGALLIPGHPHGMFRGFSFAQPPSVCGLNLVRPKPRGRILVGARRIIPPHLSSTRVVALSLETRVYPVLIVDKTPSTRLAALTTDVAPHWCGGLVDWGTRRVRLRVEPGVTIEVGDRYVDFLCRLLRWLGRTDVTRGRAHAH